LEIADQAAAQTEDDIRNSEPRLAQSPSAKKSGQLSGGLPLVVHPDFRWSPVVEQLAAGGAFADQLLTAAEQLLQEGQGRLLFASTQRQQGATTLAATTARMLIERGRRVLMVDADLGQAGWTSNLELHSAGSWVQQVEAFEPLQAAMAISRSTSSAFVALHPVGSRRELPPYLFDYLGQLLVPFKGQFDATIIDVGPISQLLEELSQPARLGMSVMVVQQGGADAAVDLRRNKTTLNAFGISRLAIARNFAA
jgi:Mrp family chromosome partitioning ATPase